jgi:hypothetical protein
VCLLRMLTVQGLIPCSDTRHFDLQFYLSFTLFRGTCSNSKLTCHTLIICKSFRNNSLLTSYPLISGQRMQQWHKSDVAHFNTTIELQTIKVTNNNKQPNTTRVNTIKVISKYESGVFFVIIFSFAHFLYTAGFFNLCHYCIQWSICSLCRYEGVLA